MYAPCMHFRNIYKVKIHLVCMEIIKKNKLIQKMNKDTKVNYLRNIGLFNENTLREMDADQINELVASALEVKGF